MRNILKKQKKIQKLRLKKKSASKRKIHQKREKQTKPKNG
jgi:hypothetical protein